MGCVICKIYSLGYAFICRGCFSLVLFVYQGFQFLRGSHADSEMGITKDSQVHKEFLVQSKNFDNGSAFCCLWMNIVTISYDSYRQ